jgi:hypothetical protein
MRADVFTLGTGATTKDTRHRDPVLALFDRSVKEGQGAEPGILAWVSSGREAADFACNGINQGLKNGGVDR